MSLTVSGEAENTDCGLVTCLKYGQRSRDLVGAIGSNQKVDFVDVDEFRVDRWFVRRRCLVIVINQLYWTTKQSTFAIYIVAPDFERDKKLLSIRPVRAGHPHAETHSNRLSRPRGICNGAKEN